MANHCETFKSLMIILTLVAPSTYVQVILTPRSFVCGADVLVAIKELVDRLVEGTVTTVVVVCG